MGSLSTAKTIHFEFDQRATSGSGEARRPGALPLVVQITNTLRFFCDFQTEVADLVY